tara:strand:- start:262 stop:840 length:579 start_codon:yes stop_codon:yes gene_type:complete
MRNLIIVSAPSGTGKTTICKALQERDKTINFSISCTTRKPRAGEKDGVDYKFVNVKEFKDGIEKESFAEWEKIHGNNYYGTLLSTLSDAVLHKQLLLLELDVKGAMTIKNLYPNNTISIFIEPPSLEELKSRLKNRGTESNKNIIKRLERLDGEISFKPKFDFCIINDDIQRAVNEIINIINNQNKGVSNGS